MWTIQGAVTELLSLPQEVKKVIAFSGGKDSTALLAIAIKAHQEGLQNIEVIHSNTLMEIPYLDSHVLECKKEVEKLGINFLLVTAPIEKRFFYQLIGKGLSSPTRHFRWCTQALKIDPMKKELKKKGDYILINGERMGESKKRDFKLKSSCSDGTNECGVTDLTKQIDAITRPLLIASSCNVWDTIATLDITESILLGSFERLSNVYSINEEENSNSLRTGCIGCPLVNKDKSLAKMIKEKSEYKPLENLRSLYDLTRVPENRILRPDLKGKGAVKLEVRKDLWSQILLIEEEVKVKVKNFILIEDEEKEAIERALSEGKYPSGYTKEHIAKYS